MPRVPRLAANLSLLYPQLEFLDRFAAAARAGFRGVEYQFPYAWPKERVAESARAAGLEVVLHNIPAGDPAKGERGLACLPGRVAEFKEGVARAIEVGTALGVPQLNCLAGKAPANVTASELRETFVSNLRYAAGELKKANLKLLIEPINTYDIPGFYLNRTAQALAILEDVGADNAFLQYDAYHMQRMEGELAATIEKHLPRIAHIQIADNPGRNEPGTGEINFANLFKSIDAAGYRGWIGCEYKPAAMTEDGLGWIQPFRR